MKEEKMKFLPKDIEWINPYSASSNSYRQVLVATNKHSVRDWEILFGNIYPIDNYTDYQIRVGDRVLEKSEVLALGLFLSYGCVE